MFDSIKVPEKVTLKKGRRACRRLAEELRAAYHLHRQIAIFEQDESNETLLQLQVQTVQRQLFNPEELTEKLEALKELSGDSQKALLKAFKRMDAAGPWRNIALAPEPEVLDGLNRDFPNFSAVTQLIQQRLVLARRAPEKPLLLPPILLDGPAGVGKTAYCQRLASALDVRFEKIDLSGASANFSMTGLDAGYSNAHPGRIWESLQHSSMSAMWLLDEVDKANPGSSHGGSNFLLGLLENESSRRFADNCTLLPIDASWICYIATCNDKSLIDAPLVSRFEIFEIAPPGPEQVTAIVLSIYRDIRKTHAWGPSFIEELDSTVIQALRNCTPREIRRNLLQAFAVAAEQSRSHLEPNDIRPFSGSRALSCRRIGFI
jgi:ATP-dependent Lon protease